MLTQQDAYNIEPFDDALTNKRDFTFVYPNMAGCLEVAPPLKSLIVYMYVFVCVCVCLFVYDCRRMLTYADVC